MIDSMQLTLHNPLKNPGAFLHDKEQLSAYQLSATEHKANRVFLVPNYPYKKLKVICL